MTALFERIKEYYDLFLSQIVTFEIKDIFDIAIVAVIIYLIMKFAKEKRAGKLVLGLAFLLLLSIIGEIFDLVALKYCLQIVFQVGIIAIVIVFQPELRSALERVGGESLKSMRNIAGRQSTQALTNDSINIVVKATFEMAKEKTGALIVFEREDNFESFLINKKMRIVNADITVPLIENIFFKNAPLHDGAMIIRDGRIYAAACYFQISDTELGESLGTRHRAAMGLCEKSDAVIIVVSEQTGTVSLAYNKELKRDLDEKHLRNILNSLLIKETAKRSRKPSKIKREEQAT